MMKPFELGAGLDGDSFSLNAQFNRFIAPSQRPCFYLWDVVGEDSSKHFSRGSNGWGGSTKRAAFDIHVIDTPPLIQLPFVCGVDKSKFGVGWVGLLDSNHVTLESARIYWSSRLS